MNPIHLRNLPPPIETFKHTEFFQFMFSWLKPECYLELGTRDCLNFQTLAKLCTKAIGVDISPIRIPLENNMEFYNMSTDNFFNQLDITIKFDAVFIDADHSHEQSLKDFMNVKDRIIEDGFIFFHDTYPYDPEYFNPSICNNVYLTALYIKQNFIEEFEILTLPFNPGVTIVKKMKRNKQLIYT